MFNSFKTMNIRNNLSFKQLKLTYQNDDMNKIYE